jgi:hypothetical protein
MNKTLIRKHVRAIYYRMLSADQVPCILAHLDELRAEVASGTLRDAIESFAKLVGPNGLKQGAYAAYVRIVELLPPRTYGELTAGTLFSIPGYLAILRKTKAGIEVGPDRTFYDHLPTTQVVIV